MYNEIEVIDTIPCKKTKVGLLLLFIQEYGGWLQHLKEVGGLWGSNGEEVGANLEAIKTVAHLEKLKSKVQELA